MRFRTVPILLALVLLATPSAFGADRYDAKSWRRVKTYDMTALQKIEPLPLRQIVAVRFNYRAAETRHLKPNWFYSSIWSIVHAGNKADFTHIPVMVAKGDLDRFKSLPTTPETGGNFVVYGQVLEDAESRFLFLRLLGTKVKTGKRTVSVTW